MPLERESDITMEWQNNNVSGLENVKWKENKNITV